MNDTMSTNDEILDAKHTDRRLKWARRERTAEALERGQRLHKDTQARLSELEAASKSAIDRRGRELAKALSIAGPTTTLPAAGEEADAAALSTARVQAAIAVSALAMLKDEDAKAQADAIAAEAAVVAVVDAIFRGEDIETARQVAHHLDEGLRLGKALLHMAVADEMDGRKLQPPQVTEVLARLDLPVLDRRHVAINLLKEGDRVAAARRAARRAALIRGDIEEEQSAA